MHSEARTPERIKETLDGLAPGRNLGRA
jgi:hypothetical protein